jgi:tRNA (guanine37-N1)-methyltransferase
MKCDIITLFPKVVRPFVKESILGRAVEKALIEVNIHHLREYAKGKHQITDDAPYGGGPGMVLKPEPIFEAIDRLKEQGGEMRIILTTPQGRLFQQETAQEFATDARRLVFVCGHYEGVDERVREGLPVEELSVGNYVLTGGELAALVMIDASARLVPGVLGEAGSLHEESFSASMLLEYPHYTRPAEFRGMRVPPILTSGNHQAIAEWRRQQAILNTQKKRPDLVERVRSGKQNVERVEDGRSFVSTGCPLDRR